jgi:four helix bundle protein
MGNFKRLRVWQKANELAGIIEPIAARVGRTKPRLADQLERAANAVCAAIAEGSGRGTDKDFANYCSTGIGEISEVENHIQRGFDDRVIYKSEYEDCTERAIQVRRSLIGLRRTLRNQPRLNQSTLPKDDPSSQVHPKPEPSPKREPELAARALCPSPSQENGPSVDGPFPFPSGLYAPRRFLHQIRHAVGHPLRRRRSLEVVIEELHVPNREVLSVGQPSQSVSFADVRQ